MFFAVLLRLVVHILGERHILMVRIGSGVLSPYIAEQLMTEGGTIIESFVKSSPRGSLGPLCRPF